MLLAQPRGSRRSAPRRHRHRPPVRPSEPHPAATLPLDPEPALVHQPMVIRAQLDQVLKRRRAAPRPVLDVVRVQEPLVTAPREPTSSVPAAQRPPQRRRNRPRPPADRQRLPVSLDDPDDRRVAPEPAHGLRCQRGPARQLRPLDHLVRRERRRVDVDHEFARIRPPTSAATVRLRGHRRPRERHQRIGPARRHRRGQRCLRLGGLGLHGLQRVDHEPAIVRGKPSLEVDRAVVVPAPPRVPELLRSLGGAERRRQRARIAAHQLLELRPGGVARDLHEPGLGRGRRRPRERTNLAVRQLPSRERLPHERQLLEPMRHPDSLACRSQRDRTSPRQPVRARLHAPFGPAAPVVELGHEPEPPAGRHRDVRGQLADLLLERLERCRRRPGRGSVISSTRTHVR